MSSAYHDEALRKTRSLERRTKSKSSNEAITVQEAQAPVFKCVPEADYLKLIEDENKKKCQKRFSSVNYAQQWWHPILIWKSSSTANDFMFQSSWYWLFKNTTAFLNCWLQNLCDKLFKDSTGRARINIIRVYWHRWKETLVLLNWERVCECTYISC